MSVLRFYYSSVRRLSVRLLPHLAILVCPSLSSFLLPLLVHIYPSSSSSSSSLLLPRVALLVVPAPRHCVNWAAPSPARHEGGDVSRARNPEKIMISYLRTTSTLFSTAATRLAVEMYLQSHPLRNLRTSFDEGIEVRRASWDGSISREVYVGKSYGTMKPNTHDVDSKSEYV